MTRPLRILDELGAELDKASARNPAGRSRLVRLDGRVGLLALLGAVATTAAATAAVILIGKGSPLPAPHSQDLRSQGIPLVRSAHLAGLDAPDPTPGEPPWDLRLSKTRAGETCTAVGQVVGGRFGIVGLDDVFRVLPVGSVDECGVASRDVPVLAGAREFLGRGSSATRTVVSGVAGDAARSVVVYGPGPPRRLHLGPDGSFLTVYAGTPEEVRPRMVVSFRDGHSKTVSFEATTRDEAPDPAGGAPWSISSEADLQPNAFPDEDCAEVMREPTQPEPRLGMQPQTPAVCGRLGPAPLFVSMRRFVPGEGSGSSYPWGDAPARTLVFGVATPRVASLSLHGPGIARGVLIRRKGGAFLAVLDGRVDPRALSLLATFKSGDTHTYDRSSPLLDAITNRPVPEPPVPAFKEPTKAPAAESSPPFEFPIEGTTQQLLHETDPVTHATWAVRSWRGAPNPAVGGAGRSSYICVELGVLVHGRLVQPGANPTIRSPSATAEQARCTQRPALLRIKYMLSFESFVEDPYAYAPRAGRVVLSGLLPSGASDPRLLGIGPERSLEVDANGAFLVVLPGRYWRASPHIVYELGGRRVGSFRGRHFPLGNSPETPQSRAPDPTGGAPWGFASGRLCETAIGRIVEGRLANLDERTGVLKLGGTVTSRSAGCIAHESELGAYDRPGPVAFGSQQIEDYAPSAGPSEPALSEPEIERRTPPGRTLITGVALPDVVSVTIVTPSDVRTLLPAGPLHTILAVYEGAFLRGRPYASVRLRDGRTLTEPIEILGGGEPPELPTASNRVADMERQLADVRRSALTYEAEHRYRRARAARTTLGRIRWYLRAAQRRLSYEHAHPGLLPAE